MNWCATPSIRGRLCPPSGSCAAPFGLRTNSAFPSRHVTSLSMTFFNFCLGKCTKISKLCPKLRQVRGTGEMVTSKTPECIVKKCDRSWIPHYRAVKQKFLAKDAAKNQKTKRENKRKSRPAVVMSWNFRLNFTKQQNDLTSFFLSII